MTGKPAPSSPCNNICRMDVASGLCEGCLRTVDEIAAWSAMGEGEKQAVWALIEARRAHGAAGAATPPAAPAGADQG